MAQKFSIIIKNGNVLDGTGNPWFKADIGIEEGKIKKIGVIRESGKKTIDADGIVVSPGFIDSHNHLDLSILSFPACSNLVMQGITTSITGNCGISMAPLNPEKLPLLKQYLSPFLSPKFDYGWDWETLKEYYGKAEKTGFANNLAPLAGHGTIRIAVKGFDSSKPTPSETEAMKKLLARSLDNGAFGMSTGLIYPPGIYADTEELMELGAVLAEYGRLYATHMRSESSRLKEALKEAIRIGEVNNIPVQISHHKAKGEENWGKVHSALRLIEESKARGIDINCDVYPYTAGSTTISVNMPGWVLEGGVSRMLERLKDKDIRDRIKREFLENEVKGENYIKDAGFSDIFVASCPSHKGYEGKSIQQIIIEKNRSHEPFEAFFDFLLEIEGNATQVHFTLDEEDVRRVMASPFSSFCTDWFSTNPEAGGKPHPRAYGVFPRILGKYVREEKLLPIQEGVRKMTSLPASILRLSDRGLIKEGFWADVVVFDPITVVDRATYQDPCQYPVGIKHVLVNGEPVVTNGELTYARPGKVLAAG